VKLEFRAITKSHRMRDSAVMMSSTIPSAKDPGVFCDLFQAFVAH
jgi:hypothetical protein